MGDLYTKKDFDKRIIGTVRKCVGGLYFVEDNNEVVHTCKARGIFRKQDISPCAGDNVEVMFDNLGADGVITQIIERRNSIVRPPLANLDNLIFVLSTCEPVPNFAILDKFIAIAEYKEIIPIIVITKLDVKSDNSIRKIYGELNITVIDIDYADGVGARLLYDMLANKISAFTGNTGVGKSTLMNCLDSSVMAETNEISKKLGRGKHTTREVELYKLKNNGYIADTPGFSTLDTNRYDTILKEDLSSCFREFNGYECKYRDCSHTKETGCGILSAVELGSISRSRHGSYVTMYEEAKKIKEWEANEKTR